MKANRIWLPLSVLGGACLAALILMVTAPSVIHVAPEALLPSVRVLEAPSRSLQLSVQSQGTVAPRTESVLVAEVSGPVEWVSPALASGGFFEPAEVLLRVEPSDYRDAVARAKAAVARTEGEWKHAAGELERREGLSRRNVASESQVSAARRTARVSEANLMDARVALDQAERDLRRTEIRAPYSGRVRDEQVDVGQFVSRGQALATLYATDYAEIRLPVPDHQLAYLALPDLRARDAGDGPSVTLRARFAGAEHSWLGRVVRTEGEIDPRSRMVHVIARVEDPYGLGSDAKRVPLAVGLFVHAEIEGSQVHEVRVVPRAALRADDQLLVVDAQDRLRLRPLVLLRADGDEAVVRVDLQPGERIGLSNLPTIIEGTLVEPMPARGRPEAHTAAADPT